MAPLTSRNASVCRIGFVGTGGVAARHAAVLAAFDDVELVAATDVDPRRVAEFARRHGMSAVADVETLLARQVDAVYVCVPPFAHGALEAELAAAGVALFVEKPLAIDGATADQIGQQLAAADVLTRVGHHWRCATPVHRARELLAGREIRLISGSWWDKVPPVGWWTDRDRSGGPLIEQAVHLLDTARVLAGDITQVHAWSAGPVPGGSVDAATAAVLRFACGAVGTLSSTCVLDGKHRAGLEIVADGLVVGVGEDWLEVHEGTDIHHGSPVDQDPTVSQGCAVNQGSAVGEGVGGRRIEFDPWPARVAADRAFVDAVRGRATDPDRSPPNYPEALRSHHVACAMARSATSGRPEQVR
jgi:myo-inositol 2-dehydrogenase/D-chiro-inositol 1-dehydrogenase